MVFSDNPFVDNENFAPEDNGLRRPQAFLFDIDGTYICDIGTIEEVNIGQANYGWR